MKSLFSMLQELYRSDTKATHTPSRGEALGLDGATVGDVTLDPDAIEGEMVGGNPITTLLGTNLSAANGALDATGGAFTGLRGERGKSPTFWIGASSSSDWSSMAGTTESITFDTAFGSAPTVVHSNESGAVDNYIFTATTSRSTTSFSVNFTNFRTTSSDTAVSYLAIGPK